MDNAQPEQEEPCEFGNVVINKGTVDGDASLQEQEEAEVDKDPLVVEDYYPNAMGIPDHDHSLHLVMTNVSHFWDYKEGIEDATRCLCKYFSNPSRINHMLAHCVLKGGRFSFAEQRMYKAAFSRLCPQWIDHRWQYREMIFRWLLDRRQIICELVQLLPSNTATRECQHEEESFTEARGSLPFPV